MPRDQILLSIVVPTRNRARYAIPMMESILDLKGTLFELVVSDNSDGEDLDRWAASHAGDSRFHYERVSGILSMTANHNRAFSMACGEFTCLIGDDDTVLPPILDACRWARDQGLDALTPDVPIRYCWPDLVHRYWGTRQAGNVYMDRWKGFLWEGEPRREALACMRRAGQGAGWLPKVYHGIVRRSLLEKLKDETGNYCLGVSPDVYLAMALAKEVNRQACTDAPLTVPGSSGESNAGRAARRRHKGDFRTDPHMVRFRNEAWPQGVPEFFSTETVWAQAALEAVRRTGWREMESLFNFPHLYARCLVAHPDYLLETRHAIMRSPRARGGSMASLWADVLLEVGRVSRRRVAYCARRLLRPTPRGYSQEYGPFPDVRSAGEFVARRFGEGLGWSGTASAAQPYPATT